MATRTTTLALEVTSEVSAATRGLEAVSSSAADAAAEVRQLGDATSGAAGKLDAVAGSADGLDSSMGAATGALGALSSGFELVGNQKAAEALQAAALATDFLSGVGQAAALATQAQAAATKGLTVAQKAANAAMRANPIGIVITAITILVGLFVLAYAKSDAFRQVVDRAGAAGKAAFKAVSTAVGDVVSWVRDRLPAAFTVIRTIITVYLTPWRVAFGLVKDAVALVADWVGRIPAKLGTLKDKAAEIAAPLLAPFQAVKDALAWIADKLDNIKPPAWLSSIPGLGRANPAATDTWDPMAPGWSGRGPASPGTPGPSTVVHVTIQGAVDPYSTAVQLRQLLARYDVAVG